MILIIDNYDSFTYNLYQMLAVEHTVQVVRNDKIGIDEIQALDPQAIILSPGPGRPENAGICVELIQQFSGVIPILGVCLGHQAIGAAFGSQIIRADKLFHGKTSQIFHNRSGLYEKLPLPFIVGRYHSLIIDKNTLADCLIVEAETSQGEIMGVRHQQHPTFGVQFHPESILTDAGQDVIENFISLAYSYNAQPIEAVKQGLGVC